jgi:Zn-dependent oligopeptidase
LNLLFYEIYFHFLFFRKLIAKFLGYSCFADIILQSKMARTKETVQDFIESTRSKLKPIYDENIRQLTAYAQEKSNKPKEYEQLQAWDIAYWRHRQCQDLYSSLKIDPLQISRHFPYEHVLNGLFHFVEFLFGIKFELENNFDEQYKWHNDVQVYRCIENGNRDFLFFYFEERKYKLFRNYDWSFVY